MMILKDLLFVFLGGGLGSVGRYGVACWLKTYADRFAGLPIHTFTVNFLGSLLIGLLLGLFAKHSNQPCALLLVTGFCGGFTTFSTFSSESVAMLRNGQVGLALAYMGVTMLLCLAATAAGYAAASR